MRDFRDNSEEYIINFVITERIIMMQEKIKHLKRYRYLSLDPDSPACCRQHEEIC